MSEPPLLIRLPVGEGIANPRSREAGEVAVGGPELPHSVLDGEGGDVRVVDEVAEDPPGPGEDEDVRVDRDQRRPSITSQSASRSSSRTPGWRHPRSGRHCSLYPLFVRPFPRYARRAASTTSRSVRRSSAPRRLAAP